MHYVEREEDERKQETGRTSGATERANERQGERARHRERASDRESGRDTDILISCEEGWKGLFSHSQISLESSLILAPDNA